MTPRPSSPSAVRVRTIAPDELHAFAVFSSRPVYTFAPSQPDAFEAWLKHYWETGNSCPEWLWEGNTPTGYAAGS